MTSETIETVAVPQPAPSNVELVSFSFSYGLDEASPYIVSTVMIDDNVSYAGMTNLWNAARA
jgi:hypothetical protein